MAIELAMWGFAINLLLFIRVLLKVPEAMRLSSEAGMLKQQVAMLWAEVEQEKVAKGVTDTDYQRELRAGYEAQTELWKLKQEVIAKEKPCDSAEQS